MQNLNINQENMENIEKAELNEEKSQQMTGYATIDKPWLQYYDREFDLSELPHTTMYQLAEMMNNNHLSRTAIDMRTSQNNFKKGITISYDKFFERIRNSAKSSLELGYITAQSNISAKLQLSASAQINSTLP